MAAAAAAAAGVIVGGYLQHRSQKNASKASQASNTEALTYQRDKDARLEATEQKRYNDRKAAYQAYVADYNRRHGIEAPAAAQQATNMSPVAVNARAAVMQQPGAVPGTPGAVPSTATPLPQGSTLRDLASGGGVPATPAAPGVVPSPPLPEVSSQPVAPMQQPRTLRDIAQWNEWDPYLQGQA